MDECLIRQYPALEESHFWFVTRRELVSRLMAEAGLGDSPRILDVGCGSGVLARHLTSTGAEVTGVDIVSHPQWEGARPEFHVGDYLELASQLGSFDCVLALDVMEHVESEADFVDALGTNLRPGGIAIVTVPAYDWLWSRHDVVNHHFRRYTRPRLVAALTASGLTVTRCGHVFLGLIAPKIGSNVVARLRNDDNVRMPAASLNQIAAGYFRWEHSLALRRRDFLPAGTSVVAVCVRRS